MRVTLIFTPNVLNPNFKQLSFRDSNIGLIPPLSLLYVAAILEREGVEVDLIDIEAEGLSYDQALERVQRFDPDLLGFSLATYSFHPILKWIAKFKADTDLPVLVGGPHVALYPQETMSHPQIDYVLCGEADLPLPLFVRAWKDGRDVSGIPSIGFRDADGTPVIDNTRQHVDSINDQVLPARHLIRNELYANILTRRRNFTAMLSARGCPYRCAFCDQKTPKFRLRSPEDFVEEVKFNLDRFGIREFDVYDSTFTANRKRVIEICERIRSEGLDVSWTVRSRVDSVSDEMLVALRKAGCHTIMYGIESSDPDILERMRKGISVDRVRQVTQFTRDQGIEMLGFFLFGFPGETKDTIRRTIDFALELPIDYAQFTVLVPFPDTEIYEYYRENGLEDYWSRYTLDESCEREIELIGTEVTRDEASDFLATAYRRFYFRPRIIAKRVLRMRSLGEFKRLANGAMGILRNSLLAGSH